MHVQREARPAVIGGTAVMLHPTPCCGAMVHELLAGDRCQLCGEQVDRAKWKAAVPRTEDHLARVVLQRCGRSW